MRFSRFFQLFLIPWIFIATVHASEGLLVPSADVLNTKQFRLTGPVTSTVKGNDRGGSGSGNQTYQLQFDAGLGKGWQAGFSAMVNDDPTYHRVLGRYRDQFLSSISIHSKWRYFTRGPLSFALSGSVEYAFISAEAGLYSDSNSGTVSDCIFTIGGKPNRDVLSNCWNGWIGSAAFPVTWKVTPNLSLDLVPGVAIFPDRFKSASYYGITPYMGFNLEWNISERFTHYQSIVFPLAGKNSVTRLNRLERSPVWRTGIGYHIDSVVTVNGYFTNSFGGTPATAILTYPSAPDAIAVGGSYAINLNGSGIDFSRQRLRRSREPRLWLGALPLFFTPSASMVESGALQISGDFNTKGGWGGSTDFGISQNFQLGVEFTDIHGISPAATLQSRVAEGLQYRFVAKARFLDQLRSPVSFVIRSSVGRENDFGRGYGQFDFIIGRTVGSSLALVADYRMTLNGGRSPHGLVMAANQSLLSWVDLIGAINVPLKGGFDFIWAIGPRFIPHKKIGIDLYATNASSQYGIGSFLSGGRYVGGAKFHLIF